MQCFLPNEPTFGPRNCYWIDYVNCGDSDIENNKNCVSNLKLGDFIVQLFLPKGIDDCTGNKSKT